MDAVDIVNVFSEATVVMVLMKPMNQVKGYLKLNTEEFVDKVIVNDEMKSRKFSMRLFECFGHGQYLLFIEESRQSKRKMAVAQITGETNRKILKKQLLRSKSSGFII